MKNHVVVITSIITITASPSPLEKNQFFVFDLLGDLFMNQGVPKIKKGYFSNDPRIPTWIIWKWIC